MALSHKMKKLLYTIIVIAGLLGGMGGVAHAASGDLFPYPVPPDTMMNLQPRCDFIVSRFWERCNFGTAFTKEELLNRTIGDWFSIMPHATADTVHSAIDRLLKRFEKKGPETLALATMAENWLYSDTAQYFSDEIYLPFAKAAAENKKIGKTDKARFRTHVQIIESSRVGATVPDIPLVNADGTKTSLQAVKGSGSILLFFNDPDCFDCTIARIKLSADADTKQLIKRGELTVVSIYPGDTDDENWAKARQSTDSLWVTVAMPEAYDYFDLRSTPLFVFLNRNHKVLATDLTIDYLQGAFRTANQATLRRNESEQQ